MNKSKIEWCDYTWNPVTGCLYGCDYCYARRIANRFGIASIRNTDLVVLDFPKNMLDKKGEIRKCPYPALFKPTFHRYRLDEPTKVKKPSKIFVSSMGDLFGEWVPDEWINEVMKAMTKAPQHTYLFLTKNPDRYFYYYDTPWQNIPDEYDFREIKFMLGTTVTNQEDINKLSMGAKDMLDFLSIEPLQGEVDISEVLSPYYYYRDEPRVKWVIIGQQTGPRALYPEHRWVKSIIDQCRAAGVPVFVKPPLFDIFPIQEWPEGLK